MSCCERWQRVTIILNSPLFDLSCFRFGNATAQSMRAYIVYILKRDDDVEQWRKNHWIPQWMEATESTEPEREWGKKKERQNKTKTEQLVYNVVCWLKVMPRAAHATSLQTTITNDDDNECAFSHTIDSWACYVGIPFLLRLFFRSFVSLFHSCRSMDLPFSNSFSVYLSLTHLLFLSLSLALAITATTTTTE